MARFSSSDLRGRPILGVGEAGSVAGGCSVNSRLAIETTTALNEREREIHARTHEEGTTRTRRCWYNKTATTATRGRSRAHEVARVRNKPKKDGREERRGSASSTAESEQRTGGRQANDAAAEADCAVVAPVPRGLCEFSGHNPPPNAR